MSVEVGSWVMGVAVGVGVGVGWGVLRRGHLLVRLVRVTLGVQRW